MKLPIFFTTVLVAFFLSTTAYSQCLKSNVFTITSPVSTFNESLQAGDCTIAQFGLDPSDISFADQWIVTVPSSGTLTIRMESTAVDSFLWLFQSNVNGANVIATDDDSGGLTTALITRNLAPGTYVILANTAFPDIQQTGPYTLTVTFSGPLPPLPQLTLTVTLTGIGSGTVGSQPGGINCPSDCSESYDSGTAVTLTPIAALGSTFAGWSGCDSVLGNLCGVSMSAAKTVTATFNPLVPSLAIVDAPIPEGNSGTANATFAVILSPASSETVTVNFSTADGSATAPSDYQTTSGILTFSPGQTSKTVTVPINGDTMTEANEAFFVNLTMATNAPIIDGQAIGTIVDDDSIAPERLVNISTRGRVLTGDNVMIGGFIITGSAPKRVLLRSRGPSMSGAPFFVPGTLSNPFLQLFSAQTVIAQNNNWQDAPSCAGFVCEGATEIVSTGLDPCQPNPGQAGPPPNCILEAAILITLPPGAYTAIVTGADGGTGVGLVEVFEADSSAPSELSNISTRGFVQTGDGVMIGGLIIEGSAPKTVLLRARGPSMGGAPFNVPGTLANPFLQLFSGQNVVAFNNNWQELQQEEVIATGLDPCQPNPGQAVSPPGCDQESALVLDLPAGGYTAIVSGIGGQTGVGLVEIFEVPDVTIPNALGNYSGSSTVTLSNCQNPANNGSFGFSSLVNLASQNGSLFSGVGTFSGASLVNLNFNGTVTAGADLMGSFTFSSSVGTGSGTFTGSAGTNTIGLNFSGQVTTGERCVLNGSASGVR